VTEESESEVVTRGLVNKMQ